MAAFTVRGFNCYTFNFKGLHREEKRRREEKKRGEERILYLSVLNVFRQYPVVFLVEVTLRNRDEF